MSTLLAEGARLERLWAGATWAEGPAWLPAAGVLRFSDVVGDRILDWDASKGATTVHADGVEFVNGRAVDAMGRVVQCSHGRRRIEREEAGEVVGLVDRFAGGRFNSPNDVVVAADGAIWFTDPPYGLHPSGREGHPGPQDHDGCFVFRFDEATGAAEPVVTDMVHPNGLAFSPDGSVLYVANTGLLRPEGGPRWIRAYDVDGSRCTNGRFFADPDVADGFRVDAEGRVWSSAGAAVAVFTADGAEVLRVPVPERVSNVAFGGPAGDDLFVTATTSLYRIRTATTGATWSEAAPLAVLARVTSSGANSR